ncbi:MAG TPA: HAMP domain-containing sensor histidine kinase, partial [Myxococcaceae bacterium]|nr:HAMP domain-containing sensor histidine kinase [Myxococcaceae bacterium]
AVDAFRTDAQRAGLVLDWQDPTGPVPVTGDDHRLGQVAANLLENALKYANSRIEVRTGADGTWSRLTVTDDGPGIAPEDLPHVFTPFFRADRSRSRSTGGFGLGLALARSIAEAHGGRLELRSDPGSGTRASLVLPRSGPVDDPGQGGRGDAPRSV